MKADDEELLAEWLDAWETGVEQGQAIALSSLTATRPDLLPELERRTVALRGLGWVDSLKGPTTHLKPALRMQGAEPVLGYRLVELLGRGGFGEVWRAGAPDGMAVALKFVDGVETAEWSALHLIKSVRHANVLSVVDAWRTPEGLVVAMELAERSLFDRWRECRDQGLPGIPADELRDYFVQAADGLDALHAAKLQHRDIKPGNLLLVGGTVKVADFGLARVLEHTQTGHTGTLTVAYAAPEFFDGKTANSSDQYSLAVTYCQLRGGRLPFVGSPAQVVAGHLRREPDLTMLPAPERPAVERALEKEPARRWPTCRAFVDSIGVARRERRWTRRAALGVGVLAAAGAGVTAFRTWGASSPFWIRQLQRVDGLRVVRSVSGGIIGRPDRDDNPRFVLATGTGGSYLWDLESGELARRFPFPAGACAAMAPFWTPRGVAGDDSGAVVEFDLETGQSQRTFKVNSKDINGLAYSPDGLYLWAAGSDGVVRRWDLRSGVNDLSLQGHQGIVTAVAVNNQRVVTGGWDGDVRVWDSVTGALVHRMRGHTAEVQSVSLSDGGKYVASGSWDGTARLWRLSDGQQERVLEGHTDHVRAVVFSSRDQLVTGSRDATLRAWDTQSGREAFRTTAPRDYVECLAMVEGSRGTGTTLVAGVAAGEVWVCRVPPNI